MKPINEIIHEMRNLAHEYKDATDEVSRRFISLILTRYANAIEQSVINCNQFKMRETLKEIAATLSVYATELLANQEVKDYFEKIIEQALSSPARNCDVLDNETDARAAWNEYCESENLPRSTTTEGAFVPWLFAEVKESLNK